MRTFDLIRTTDVTGVSGTGVVAEGTEFSDGTVALRWVVGEHRSTVIWANVDAVEAVHGHGGATTIRYHDNPPPALAVDTLQEELLARAAEDIGLTIDQLTDQLTTGATPTTLRRLSALTGISQEFWENLINRGRG